ncbi:GNAT family N-acetyltransferase [Lysobacter gummosus]|uniref:GNAT family N-acetyltransferase n=1 Tax=Lysobacter gummosus TaxID=262324 RepID=A0ABY3XGI1_9GAMM|nr:GNAT family N-acetyltransferase [Lysobacter gummosus]UNP30728.1 GNAT family N-acetyltransferase [Lysobacter gummosus]
MTNAGRPKLRQRSSIRRSRATDIKAIRQWLEEEEAQSVPGNFLCNWSIIERSDRDGELLVYIDGATGLPVAFQLGRLLHSGILQVKYDYRGRGIGRKMVEHCVQLALRDDQCLLHIQCKPSCSIPFWQRMGFKVVKDNMGRNNAFRILPKHLPLPDGGAHTRVVIRFYPENRKWTESAEPFSEQITAGRKLSCGTVKLDERVLFHETPHPDAGDVVVEIEVDGKRLHLDKAKYEESQAIGVVRCKNGWFIDQIINAAPGMRERDSG